MKIGQAALILTLVTAAALYAQTTGSIVGQVSDPSGAVMPDAKVELLNQDTGIKSTAMTSSTGDYVLPRVNPGTYQLSVSAEGFKTIIRRGIKILVNQTARQDFVLEVGEVTSSIQVQGEPPVLQSETSSVGQVVDGSQVTQMPLNGRTSIYTLLATAPGVQQAGSNPAISGSAYRGGAAMTIDGASNDDMINERLLGQIPSLDDIAEFKVVANGAPAEFGKGAQVIVASKGGTNTIHGSLFEYNRNTALAAKSHAAENIAKPPYKRNEYGGSIGGPIKKNKLFYFGSFEGLRLNQSTTTQMSLPNSAMKTGDFSSLLSTTVIKDPLANGTPFAGNVIPATRINSTAQAFLPYLQNPNLTGNGAGGLGVNFVGNSPTKQPNDRYSARGDYQISDKDTLNARYFWTNNGPYVSATGGGILFDNWGGYGITTRNLSAGYTRILTASLVNVFNFGLDYFKDYRTPQNSTFNPSTIIPGDPVPQPGLGGLPTINISNFTTIQDQPGSADVNHMHTISDSVTWQRDKHTLKAGFTFSRISVVNRQNSSPYRGSFSFDGRWSGESFADFLLGDMSQSSFTTSNFTLDDLNYRSAYYVQDDWRVSPRLTINAGVRYEYQTPWEKRNDLAYWSPNLNQLVVVQGTALPAWENTVPQVSGQSMGVTASNYMSLGKKNFAPRFGFAYRPFKANRLVLRSSYGIFYNPMSEYDDQIDVRDFGLNPPFRATETFLANNSGTPTITWSNPFPGTGSSGANPNPSVYGMSPNFHMGYEQNWNFTAEWEALHNTAVRASYVGNKGTHLPMTVDVNQPLPSPLPVQSIRPYQPWADVYLYQSIRNNIMNQAQLGVTHRVGMGLEVDAEYSFTKDLTPSYDGVLPYDPYNIRLDRGNSSQYVRHYFVINYIYDLPIGTGKVLLGNASPRINKLIGGWQLAGILTAASGNFSSVTFNSTLTGWPSGRANIVGNPSISNQSQYQWFNTSAYAIPSAYTFGNSAPYSVMGPGLFNWDSALFKHTDITDRLKLEIRMETYDFMNHAYLSGLQTNISVPAQFGICTGRTDSRVVQFGARFSF